MTLILASNSPRRRELLALAGLPFTTQPADVDESRLPGEPAADYVRRLAQCKARAAAQLAPADAWVLAADTTVALEDDLLGKPAGAAEARRILERLRGRTHSVLTALALVRAPEGAISTELCVSPVRMRAYSDAEIETYIASGDPFDKAGGYAIQNRAFHPVANFSGCAASVMGLPLCHLARMLARRGITPPVDIPTACQTHLDYACPIYATVLRGEDAG
jgi:septum formation protein